MTAITIVFILKALAVACVGYFIWLYRHSYVMPKAEHHGRVAATYGVARRNNPYTINTEEWIDWNKGWMDASREQRSGNQ